MILISHDLVRGGACWPTTVAVMFKAATSSSTGPARMKCSYDPQHDYTRTLLDAIPCAAHEAVRGCRRTGRARITARQRAVSAPERDRRPAARCGQSA